MNYINQTPNTRMVYEAPRIEGVWKIASRSLLETFSLEGTFEDFEEDENVEL